jgi:hypothetical protein
MLKILNCGLDKRPIIDGQAMHKNAARPSCICGGIILLFPRCKGKIGLTHIMQAGSRGEEQKFEFLYWLSFVIGEGL